jgi:putative transcriptional regulator
MTSAADLSDHFLLAMPGLQDPNFNQSLTYICSHDEHGAMGLVVNRPMEIGLRQLLDQLAVETTISDSHSVLCGGPVEPERGFILHSAGEQSWQSTMQINSTICLTVSLDIIHSMANNQGPDNFLVALGYAGWGAGQLEAELADNTWLTIPADSVTLFDTPCEDQARVAALKLGFDLTTLSGLSGHA